MRHEPQKCSQGDDPVLLVVGNLMDWAEVGKPLPTGDGFEFMDYRDFGPDVLDRIRPEIVLSGLFGRGFDALDIASVLQSTSFEGRYRVIAERIPKPSLVRAEVRHVAPDLDFDVINLKGDLAEFI